MANSKLYSMELIKARHATTESAVLYSVSGVDSKGIITVINDVKERMIKRVIKSLKSDGAVKTFILIQD